MLSRTWFLILFFATITQAQSTPPSPVAFENVTVIPMDRERVLPAQTVLVRGRRIVEMGPRSSVRVPGDAVRIDGAGKFLLPGLAGMHGHLPGETPPEYGTDYMDRVLFLFVANGVTTVRGMLGVPKHLEVRGQVARGERLGPQIFTTGPSFNGQSVPTVEAAWRMLTEQRAAGYDLLKIHPGIARPVYDEIVRTAERERIAFGGHVPADVGLERALMSRQSSVDHLDGWIEAIVKPGTKVDPKAPSFFGFHLTDDVDTAKIPEVVAATRAGGTWNVPTQVLFENRFSADSPETRAESPQPERSANEVSREASVGVGPHELIRRPEMKYVPTRMREQWVAAGRDALDPKTGFSRDRAERFLALRRKIVKALADGGAGLLLGADTPQVFNVPGFATLQEIEALVAAGLTPYQALEAGTRSPASYFGLESSFGTVEVGKRADLLLLNANPLTDVRAVRDRAGVMVGGKWVSREEIAQKLASLETR